MQNILIIDAYKEYPFTEGRLNHSLIERATAYFEANGYSVKFSKADSDYNIDEEIAKHQWADVVMLQFPLHWMGVPWPFKKYMDEVYTTGVDGRLCRDDGRTRKDPSKQYGTGGTLSGKKYWMSMTANAPAAAFDDKNQYLFKGASVDELLLPMHANFRFFDMQPLPTFVCFDVVKNPEVDDYFARFDVYLAEHFPKW